MDEIYNKLIENGGTWALTIAILLFAGVKLYTDLIKPWFTNKLENAKEVDKETKLKEAETKAKNKEVEKYNIEEARWEKIFLAIDKLQHTVGSLVNVIDSFVKDNINEINYNFSERIIRIAFENSAFRLQGLIHKIITQNHRLDKLRQSHIKSTIISFLKIDEQEMVDILRDVRYNGVPLSMYFSTINNEHRDEFCQLIFGMIFDETLTTERLLSDINDIVKSHYKTHVSDALDFINKKIKQNE